jgi:hypothetical protein
LSFCVSVFLSCVFRFFFLGDQMITLTKMQCLTVNSMLNSKCDCLFVSLSVCSCLLSLFRYINFLIVSYFSICLSVFRMFSSLSFLSCIFVYFSICHFVCLFVSQFVWLSDCMFVYLSFHIFGLISVFLRFHRFYFLVLLVSSLS